MKEIETKLAPNAVGPYSQAICAGNMVFVSGQLPIVPETGVFPSEDIRDQTRQSLENVKAILAEAGYGMNRIVKVTVFLADMADFSAMNEVYAMFFSRPYPSRCAIQAAAIPKGARVEIDAIAI